MLRPAVPGTDRGSVTSAQADLLCAEALLRSMPRWLLPEDKGEELAAHGNYKLLLFALRFC